MAQKSEDTNSTAGAATKTKPEKKETVYSITELANAGRAKFNAPPEAVMAALKTAGKKEATLTEALEIVKKFMERPVK